MKLNQVIIRAEITMVVYYPVTVVPRHWSCYVNRFLYFDNTSIYARCCLPLKFCNINIKDTSIKILPINIVQHYYSLLFFFTELSSEAIMECMTTYSTSSNARLANLAKIFLQVYHGMHSLSISQGPPKVKSYVVFSCAVTLYCIQELLQ